MWVLGHTTWSTPNLTIDGVRVCSNRRGGFNREMTQRYTLRLERAQRKGHVWRPEFWRAVRILSVKCPIDQLGDNTLEDDVWKAVEEAAKEVDGDESEASVQNKAEMDVDLYSDNAWAGSGYMCSSDRMRFKIYGNAINLMLRTVLKA